MNYETIFTLNVLKCIINHNYKLEFQLVLSAIKPASLGEGFEPILFFRTIYANFLSKDF